MVTRRINCCPQLVPLLKRKETIHRDRTVTPSSTILEQSEEMEWVDVGSPEPDGVSEYSARGWMVNVIGADAKPKGQMASVSSLLEGGRLGADHEPNASLSSPTRSRCWAKWATASVNSPDGQTSRCRWNSNLRRCQWACMKWTVNYAKVLSTKENSPSQTSCLLNFTN